MIDASHAIRYNEPKRYFTHVISCVARKRATPPGAALPKQAISTPKAVELKVPFIARGYRPIPSFRLPGEARATGLRADAG